MAARSRLTLLAVREREREKRLDYWIHRFRKLTGLEWASGCILSTTNGTAKSGGSVLEGRVAVATVKVACIRIGNCN